MSDLYDALSETAMLATLKASAFGTSRRDKVAGHEVSAANDAVPEAAKVNVNILAGADTLHKEITALQREARTAFNHLTTVWDEDSWRLLPNAHFARLVGDMRPVNDRIGELKARLEEEAPTIIARAEANLGKLAGRVSMPTPAEMVAAYSIKLDFVPVPNAKHLPTNLPEGTLMALRHKVQRETERKVQEAMRAPLVGLAEQLAYFVERMDAANERDAAGEGGRKGSFRGTLVTNLNDLMGVLGAFNLTNDPAFQDVIDRMQAMLDGVTVDVLRASKHAREKAKADAEGVLDLLAAFR